MGTGWGSRKIGKTGWERGGGCEKNLKRGGDGVGVSENLDNGVGAGWGHVDL